MLLKETQNNLNMDKLWPNQNSEA